MRLTLIAVLLIVALLAWIASRHVDITADGKFIKYDSTNQLIWVDVSSTLVNRLQALDPIVLTLDNTENKARVVRSITLTGERTHLLLDTDKPASSSLVPNTQVKFIITRKRIYQLLYLKSEF